MVQQVDRAAVVVRQVELMVQVGQELQAKVIRAAQAGEQLV
jgi:hypothetical protein